MKYIIFILLAGCSLLSSNSSTGVSTNSESLGSEYSVFYLDQKNSLIGSTNFLAQTLEPKMNAGGLSNIIFVFADYAYVALFPPYATSTNFQDSIGAPVCLDGTPPESLLPEVLTFLGGTVPPAYSGGDNLPDGFTPIEGLGFTYCKIWYFSGFKPVDIAEDSTFSLKNTGIFYPDASSPSTDVDGVIQWDELSGVVTLPAYTQRTGEMSPDNPTATITFQQPFSLTKINLVTTSGCTLESLTPDSGFSTSFNLVFAPGVGTNCSFNIADGAFVTSTPTEALPFSEVTFSFIERMVFTVEFPNSDQAPDVPSGPLSYLKPVGMLTWDGKNLRLDKVVNYTQAKNTLNISLVPSYALNLTTDIYNESSLETVDGEGSNGKMNAMALKQEDITPDYDNNIVRITLSPKDTFEEYEIGDDTLAPLNLTFLGGFYRHEYDSGNAIEIVSSKPTVQKNLFWSRLYDINNTQNLGYTSGTSQKLLLINPARVGIQSPFISTDIAVTGSNCSLDLGASSVANSNDYVYSITVSKTDSGVCSITVPQGFFKGIDYDVFNKEFIIEMTFVVP